MSSVITGPGTYDTAIAEPGDGGSYVIMVWIEGALIRNLLFEVE